MTMLMYLIERNKSVYVCLKIAYSFLLRYSDPNFRQAAVILSNWGVILLNIQPPKIIK